MTRKRNGIADYVTEEIFDVIDKLAEMGFESREGQESIMLNIVDIYKDKKNLLVEAGVGIGKSLSYLIPGTLISRRTSRPLVVATSSIQLTEQLLKDIELVEKILNVNIDKVVGKGQKNYPCERRVRKFCKNDQDKYQDNLNKLIDGADKQNPNGINLDEWDNICVESCSFERCKDHYSCVFYKMREKINCNNPNGYFNEYVPKIIIVNQDLLISHLLKYAERSEPLIYPNYCMLVIDEIHNLEEKMRSALTNEIDKDFVRNFFSDYLGYFANIENSEEKKYLACKCRDKIVPMLDTIHKELLLEAHKSDYEGNFERLFVKQGNYDICSKIYLDLKKLKENLDVASIQKPNPISRLFNDNRDEFLREKLEKIISFIIIFGGLEKDPKYLLWGNLSKNMRNSTICYCKKRVYLELNKLIFSKSTTTIGLSATITVKEKNPDTDKEMDSYKYIKENIGYEGETDDVKLSPFKYDESRLFIPNSLPNYKKRDNNYYIEIANTIYRIVENNNGGSLILFTAKEDLKVVGKLLKETFKGPIYEDGCGMSQKQILCGFKETGGIILGTGVFWEGIDLKGDLLTCVVIIRLPFPVPNPILEYKISRVSGDRDKVLVPEMITKLKQGSGRLIRSMEDKGVLAILDSRMNSNIYKHRQLILNSLPIKEIVTDYEELKVFQKSL